jgi:hypothetical protein
MSSFLGGIAQAWREIAFVAGWSGISVGVLVGLCFLVYLDPLLRKVAIRIGIGVVLGYLILIYGYRHGTDNKQAEWDAANARVAAQIKQRDADEASAAGADAATAISALQAGQKLDQEQVNALRKLDANCHPIIGDQLR